MNATIKKAFAVYSTDDRGYNVGDPLAIYPFAAAANASDEGKTLGGYSSVNAVELLQFEDVNYILEKKVDKDNVIGKIKMGVPQKAYRDYIYENSYDKTKYIVGDDNLIEYISKAKSVSLSKIILTCDEDNVYVLRSENTFAVKPFVLSRELAIQAALDKLTDEEKKLLGLK